MAGQPKRREVTRELQRRAREISDDATMLDYVAHWTGSGKTLVRLSVELTDALGVGDISREFLRRTLVHAHGEEAVTDVMSRARLIGASAIVEEGHELIESVDRDRDAIAKAKLQADFRAKMAAWWNREEFGEKTAPLVQLSIAELHLDAMRQYAIRNPSRATAQLAQPTEEQAVTLLPQSDDTS